jgi:xanthine dehydrogenase YagS FAD-binding subunit
MLPAFAYVRPRSVKEALAQLATSGAHAQGGGSDLLGCVRDGVVTPERVVHLGLIGEMQGVAASSDGGLRIGALTTIAEIAAHPVVKEKYLALAQAAAQIASPQLRNQGTLGGNLCQRPRCWYFRGEYHCARKGGDMCYAMQGDNRFHAIFGGSSCYVVHPSDSAPALIALGASIRIHGPQGVRTVTADSFFVGPDKDVTRETVVNRGELVTEVLLPAPAAGTKSTYRKVRARGAWDFALAGAAVVLAMKEGKVASARIVLSGVAPIPWRVAGAERALVGHKPDPKVIAQAAAAAATGADPMEHNAYKVDLVRGVVTEAIEACL